MGDHLPGLYPESAFKNNPESQYQTDYFILVILMHRNWTIPWSIQVISLLWSLNRPFKSFVYYALFDRSTEKASVDKKALEGRRQEIAEDLKMVEYDLISGKGYLSKDLFKVPTNKSN